VWDRSARADDAALVEQVVMGSHDALAVLYDRYADAVFATAGRLTSDRHVAEDVVQETFLALWNRAELFDPLAGSLAGWLHTIARNRAIDRLRAAGRRPLVVPLAVAGGADEDGTATLERLVATGTVIGGAQTDASPDAALAGTEVRDAIRAALATMPDVERTVIVLAYAEDLSQSEIAGRLGWPIGTVKTRTRRALRRLREGLADELGPSSALDVVPVPAGERT
jgi:RNA polymerase sigma-70 factor (ECF subfamily)